MWIHLWMHGAWLVVAVLAAWIAYRVGIAVESHRTDDEVDQLEHTLAGRMRREREMAKVQYDELNARYRHLVDILARGAALQPPAPLVLLGESLTVAQADRLVVEERKKARETALARQSQADGHATESTEGMELVGIADGEALPVSHLEEPEERG